MKQTQISVPSHPEITEPFKAVLRRVAEERDFLDHKPGITHLINGLALWLNDLNPRDQMLIASVALNKCERFIMGKRQSRLPLDGERS
jgi:hypothetical protein